MNAVARPEAPPSSEPAAPPSEPDATVAAPLPREARYLPFEPGPYKMAMGLATIPHDAWFELDEHYPAELRERRRLLAERHAEVFAALPVSDAARAEDLCLIQCDGAVPLLTAAVLCFPSRWRLAEKLGRPLAAVHKSVPYYAERLAGPVDRFMRHLKAGHIAARLNWSVLDDAALFQPTGKWREAHNPTVTPLNAGDTLFLRVERQTLRRLPRSDAILFGIRVHVYGLSEAVRDADDAARLAAALRALPDATAHYKSLPPIRGALLAWLDPASQAEGGARPPAR
jgi:hypothetical protein